jgi:hypothetical protein
MNDFSLPERDTDGKLPAYAWPGGYTLVYYAEDGSTYCADCASQTDAEPPIVACDTYDEGPALYCDGCNAVLESSYGDPDEEETE